MLLENDNKVMRAPNVSGRPLSRHTSTPLDRAKKPNSHVERLPWLLLLVLLAGQASCNPTASTSSPHSATTSAQPPAVYYFFDISVAFSVVKNESDIKAQLTEVFQKELESCLSSSTSQNTTSTKAPSSTSQHTTATRAPSSTSQHTTATRASSSTSQHTTATRAPSSTSQHTTATRAPSSTSQHITATRAPSSISQHTTATRAPSSTSQHTTATRAPSSTSQHNTATKAPSSTSQHNTATRAPSSTALKSTKKARVTTKLSTTEAQTLETSGTIIPALENGQKNKPWKNTNSTSFPEQQHMTYGITGNDTQTSGVSGGNTTFLFQGIEVKCMQTEVGMDCIVTLQLRHNIPACCILRVLCEANQASSGMQLVGKRADRTSHIQNDCHSEPQEENSCIYDDQAGAICEESAFVANHSNSSNCGPDTGDNSCNCSAYCGGTDAYYASEFSVNYSEINVSHVLSLIINTMKGPELNCSLNETVPCSLSNISSLYKEAYLTCEIQTTNLQNCSVIVGFTNELPVCTVSGAVMSALQDVKQISYSGLVTRVAICRNQGDSANLLNSHFTLAEVNQTSEAFCGALEETNHFICQAGETVAVLLDEVCVQGPPTIFSTIGTTTQPQTTSSSVNVTSSPTSTATTKTQNATTGTTTTTATTSGFVSTTTSEIPTTTESDDSQADALLSLARNVSQLNSSEVDQLVSQLENLLTGPNISMQLGNASVQIVSSLLQAPAEMLANSSSRIIGIVDTVALKLVLEEQAETLLSPALAISVKPADGANFQETFFSISDPDTVQVRGDPRLRRSVRSDPSLSQGSIMLPPSLTQNIGTEQQNLVSRVQFNFFQNSTVFQDKSLGERRVNSGILGASVANLSIAGLQDNVIIHLRNTEPVPANFVSVCVFWDSTSNDGSGGWNSNGCFVRNSTANETVCSCNHLTSFAILLDLSRDPLTSRAHATVLTFITYIGCGVSAIFLSVTLLTYLAFGKLRKDIPSKILIQLCLALLLLNLVFLVDAWLALYPDALGLCISTAWFLHYFLLVTFTWMGLEAVHMYLALVKVFNSYISRYMIKFSLVGWGIPMIVVIIVIAIDKDNYGLISYGRFTDGSSDDFCWLKNDIAFYVAVVAYFCIIFVFNFIMFIMVLVQLCRIKRQNPHNATNRNKWQDVRSVMGLTLLLGLTWGFAFFAWGPVNLVFMYLFAIFNSLQGLFIFVFHCAVKENVRKQWRTYLCCGRMRLAENSEWSRTATQKTAKKSSVTRQTSLQSSKSNNTSSSSSYFVSDSTEQIGSQFEDRTLTADENRNEDVILNEINRQYRNQ